MSSHSRDKRTRPVTTDGDSSTAAERMLVSALEESLESDHNNGMSADLAAELQQRRLRALAGTGNSTAATSSRSWRDVWSQSHLLKYGGAVGVCIAIVSVWLMRPVVPPVQETHVVAQVPVSDVSDGMDDFLLVSSVNAQDWELIENSDFLAWLEDLEQSEGHIGHAG